MLVFDHSSARQVIVHACTGVRVGLCDVTCGLMCVLSPVYSQMLRAVVAPPYPQAVCLAATVAGWATQCCVLAPARHGFCGVTKPRARALHAQGGDVSSLFSSYRVSSGGQPLSASFCLYFPVGLLFGSCEGRDFLLALPEARNHLRCICCSR